MYHLDEYDECLSHADGLYCVGVFQVAPPSSPDPTYDLIKEYSEETFTFNRTLLHRGYCVSKRCPEFNTTNPHDRFARCGAKLEAAHNLTVELRTIHYCTPRSELTRSEAPSIGQIVFLVVMCAIVVLNIIGTLYDWRCKDKLKKKSLTAWSIIGNWKCLTSADNIYTDPMAALHGIKVTIAVVTCIVHATVIAFTVYQKEPRVLEGIISHPAAMVVQNSTAAGQMFLLITGFLYAVLLRELSSKVDLSVRLIPFCIFKRWIRLAPVGIFTVSFAATWFPTLSSGPIWRLMVGAESDICKDKFWTHILMVNNLIQTDKHCVLPTWYLAADMQLHVISTFVLVFLLMLSKRILLILCGIFSACCIFNAALAYAFNWMPMLYLAVSPENLRTLFREVPSFAGLYISPWGNMHLAILGLIIGYMYYDLKDQDFSIGKYKWIIYTGSALALPLVVLWSLMGYFVEQVRVKVFMVAYAAVERSAYQILVLIFYVLMCIAGGFVVKFLAWRGWRAMSRVALPVMMIHWMINLYLVGSTPQPISTSGLDILLYGVSTTVYSFLLAIPITLLIEMPFKRFFDALFGWEGNSNLWKASN